MLWFTAICIINAHQHFEFSIGNAEIMQKLPLKSVIFIQKVPFILHIAVQAASPMDANAIAGMASVKELKPLGQVVSVYKQKRSTSFPALDCSKFTGNMGAACD